VPRRGPGGAGRPHGQAARRHLRTAAMKTSEAAGISRESVATVMNSTRWDRYFRKRGLRRAQVIQSVGY
ncbi:MAG: hypothetical protein ACXVA6_17810, partial [Isosphaeraceae bacterium]